MTRSYLITAATGIGAATARRLAQSAARAADSPSQPGEAPNGASIFFSSMSEAGCHELKRGLQGLGADAEFMVGDLTDPEFAPRLVRSCVARFGRLDALFNIAGISGRKFGDGPVHECSEEGWRRTIETNLTTQYRMCREAIRVMLAQPLVEGERGVILNMSSILALHPEPEHFDAVAYAASKGGILSLSRTMAASYAKNKIRVNAVAPALVETAMSARASKDEEILRFIRGKQPLAEGTIPAADVARVCAFLLGRESFPVTGQSVEVGAGWEFS